MEPLTGASTVLGADDELLKNRIEETDGLPKAVMFYGHDHVDGIEVALTAEASCQVGLGVDRGVKVATERTHEAEPAVMVFVGYIRVSQTANTFKKASNWAKRWTRLTGKTAWDVQGYLQFANAGHGDTELHSGPISRAREAAKEIKNPSFRAKMPLGNPDRASFFVAELGEKHGS